MLDIYNALTTDNSDSGELKQTVSENDLTTNPFKITPGDAQVANQLLEICQSKISFKV
jgi:hypothetical protein